MSQVQRPKTWKKWLALILFLSFGGGFAYFYSKKSKPQGPLYQTVPATLQKIQVTILSTGIVQPENRLEIKPPVSGRVEDVAVAEGSKVKKGQILAWMSSTERAALLDAARSKGPAEVKRWEGLYRPTAIIAPINGTIILRNVEAGQTFTGQDSVFVISDRLTIKAQVDETDLAQIKVGQSASIVLDAYPKEQIKARVGKLAFDAKTISNVTSYLVSVQPLVSPEFIRSGMTANVTFLVDEKESALSVPSEAIKFKDKEATVLMNNPEDPKKPLERTIKIGISDGKVTEVIEGLSLNDAVLILDIKSLGEGKAGSSSPFAPFGSSGPRKAGK